MRLRDVEAKDNELLKLRNRVLRASNPGKIAPRELRKTDLGALEASWKERSGQESSKKLPKGSQVTIPGACRQIMSSREAPERPPRAPQRSPGGPQETPKSTQKRPSRAPIRSQDHVRIANADFSKIELPSRRNQGFRGSEGHLGSSKSTPRGSKRSTNTSWKKI